MQQSLKVKDQKGYKTLPQSDSEYIIKEKKINFD
jgi:hypothetical protein